MGIGGGEHIKGSGAVSFREKERKRIWLFLIGQRERRRVGFFFVIKGRKNGKKRGREKARGVDGFFLASHCAWLKFSCNETLLI